MVLVIFHSLLTCMHSQQRLPFCLVRVPKEPLLAEEDDELKEVTDLRKIAAQLLQQEQKNR